MIPLSFTVLFWVHGYIHFLCFLSREDPLAFVGELVCWCWILSFFFLSVKLFISPSYLNKILAGYSNLGYRLFSFSALSMSCHSFLSWRVSIERLTVILLGIPLCVICCFSLADFNICSLCLTFVNLINMCLGVFCLGFILFRTFWVSWTWVIISFPILGKFSASPQVLSHGLSFHLLLLGLLWFECWGIYHCPRGLWGCPYFFQFFFPPFPLFFNIFLPFYLLPHLSYLLPPIFYLWIPPECFF